MERMKGIEPSQSAWKAEVLPLNYIRRLVLSIGVEPIRLHRRWILSPLRLPIPPTKQLKRYKISRFGFKNTSFEKKQIWIN